MRSKPDNFTYLSCCGKGGYGEAWLVREPHGPCRVLKIIYKDCPAAWRTEREGLAAYYEKLSDLTPEEQHCIVTVLHNGENDECIYYTMPAADNMPNGSGE